MEIENATISDIVKLLDPSERIRIRYQGGCGSVYTGAIKGMEKSKNKDLIHEAITEHPIVLMEVERGVLTFRLKSRWS